MGKKKALTGALLAAAIMTVAGCSGRSTASGETAKAPADPADASGTIKVLTHRTDLVQNGTMAEYAAGVQQDLPGREGDVRGPHGLRGRGQDTDVTPTTTATS